MSGKKTMNDEQTEGAAASGGASLMDTRLPGSTLGSDIQAKIGQHLRAMYDDVVRQGVPDRFMDLLSQLDQAAKPAADGNAKDQDEGGHR
jgi:hypothetical protein